MEEAFQRIYEKYHSDLFQFLFYMVKNREQAEDLVQEVYIRILKSHGSFEGRSSEKTWIISIARHVAIDFFRKQKTLKQRIFEAFDWDREQIRDQQPLPEEIAALNEEMQMVYRTLDTCTVDQKAVVILRYIQGMSIADTAAALGFTESKVKTTQHRALKALKNKLSEHSIRKEGIAKG